MFSAASSGGRAMKTLRTWGLEIDEGNFCLFLLIMTSFLAFFMAGAPKGPLLHEIKPHLFFDDQVLFKFRAKFNPYQVANVQSGLEFGLPAAHVPWGVANQN